jgi:predicted PurR-regulated permease PerM
LKRPGRSRARPTVDVARRALHDLVVTQSAPAAVPPIVRTRPLFAAFVVLALAALLYAVVVVRTIFLFGFFAVLLAVVLSYPVDWLSRRMPRGLAVLITLAAMVGAIAAAVAGAAPIVDRQLSQLMERLPEASNRIESWWYRSTAVTELPHGQQIADTVRGHVATEIASVAGKAVPAAASLATIATGIVLLIALAFFLVSEPDAYRRGLRKLVPATHEAMFDRLLDRQRTTIRKYMGGILVSMTLMGTLTAIGLKIAGIDGWFALGLLTFFGTFIPYAGAIASAIPGLAVGLAQSPQKFLYALAVYAGVHVVEGYIVEPIIMKHAVTLRPAALLLWQLVMGALFGVLGIVVAAPTLACVKVAVECLYIERKDASLVPPTT